jgi:hypothetical protein
MRRRTLLAGLAVPGLGLGLFVSQRSGGGTEVDAGATGTAAAPQPAKDEEPAGATIYGEWSIAIRPDKVADYNRLIEREGLPLFRKAGGRMVGWWTTLIGDLYEQVTIWEYDGLPAYEKAGAILGKDRDFARFVDQRDPLLAGERSRFLKLAEGGIKPALPESGQVVVHEVHRVPLGRMAEYLTFVRRELPTLKKHGFRPVGPWQTAVGRWSEVVYLFRFDSLAERDRLITAFSAHQDGKAYAKGVAEFVDEVTTRVLTPAPHAR